ncbi:MAG: HPr family phosphocarrier protein [Gemmatimonadota bacterium]
MMLPASEATVQVPNRLGLHARPAAQVVMTAARFVSEIFISREDMEVNGKSILGVMMLVAEQGANLRVRATGADADAAVAALAALIGRGFDEDDEGRPVHA